MYKDLFFNWHQRRTNVPWVESIFVLLLGGAACWTPRSFLGFPIFGFVYDFSGCLYSWNSRRFAHPHQPLVQQRVDYPGMCVSGRAGRARLARRIVLFFFQKQRECWPFLKLSTK